MELDSSQQIDLKNINSFDISLVSDVESIPADQKIELAQKPLPDFGTLKSKSLRERSYVNDDYFNLPKSSKYSTGTLRKDKIHTNLCGNCCNCCGECTFINKLMIFFSRIIIVVDVFSDLVVDINLFYNNDYYWGLILALFIALPYFVCFITTGIGLHYSGAFKNSNSNGSTCIDFIIQYFYTILYIIFGFPLIFCFDFYALFIYPFSMPTSNQLLVLLRMRALTEVFLESIPQLGLQIYIYFSKNNYSINDLHVVLNTFTGLVLVLSIFFSLFSVLKTIVETFLAARYHGVRVGPYLRSVFMGGLGLTPYLESINRNRIKEVNYESNMLAYKQMVALSHAIGSTNCSALKKINLSNNHLNGEGLVLISKGIQTNQFLEELDLCNNEIEDITPFSNALMLNKSLHTINLSINKISDDGFTKLSEPLQQFDNISKLYLSSNDISSDGILVLVRAITNSTKLKYLDLSNNINIGDLGAMEFAKCLCVNTSLETLLLSNCSIGDHGVRAISESLKINKTLTSLNIAGDELQDSSIKELAEAIKSNTSLKTLTLAPFSISDNNREQVAVLKAALAYEKRTVHGELIFDD